MKLTFPYKKLPVHRSYLRLGILLVIWMGLSSLSWGHDIPSVATIHIYIKPENNQLNVLLRVPLETLGEIDFPKRGPGYLDFSNIEGALEDAVDVYLMQGFNVFEADVLLKEKQIQAVRVSLPTDKSFISYESASKNFSNPALNNSADLYWAQGVLDAWIILPIESEDSAFAIESNLDRLGLQTTTVLRYVLPSGGERLFNYLGNPGVVELDPSFLQAIWRFVVLGFDHILDGIDHLLFLLCLVIPLRRIRSLIPVITSFTIAHSITLISSAFGLVPNVLWFGPMIELLIALSIVYMAIENILFAASHNIVLKHRWLVTFGFGLVHGFGFSFVLAETMQFAGGHLFSSLLAFNLGVELGQLLVLVIVVPVLALLFKTFLAEKVGVILLSVLVAHTAWHWMMERGVVLLQYNLQWPVLDLVFLAGLMRWLMLLLVVAAVAWMMMGVFKRYQIAGKLPE